MYIAENESFTLVQFQLVLKESELARLQCGKIQFTPVDHCFSLFANSN